MRKIEMLLTTQKGLATTAAILVATASAVSLDEVTRSQVMIFEQPVTMSIPTYIADVINIGEVDSCDTGD